MVLHSHDKVWNENRKMQALGSNFVTRIENGAGLTHSFSQCRTESSFPS